MADRMTQSRRDHEQRPSDRSLGGLWRHLDLIGPTGRTFLRRRGLDTPWGGILIHRLDGPDPGLDLHDHPWSFVSLVLCGGYTEEWSETRTASMNAARVKGFHYAQPFAGGRLRSWRRGSVHRMPLDIAHRITAVEPGTVTLVLRRRKVRRWGFYLAGGWVDWEAYDYDARRPVTVESNRPDEVRRG